MRSGLILTCQPVQIPKLAKEETDNALPNDVFIGAAVSLLCAPAIVRPTSLMPVCRLTLPIGPQYAGFWERLVYDSVNRGLRSGQVTTVLNGKLFPVADARRMVAYARAQGWLPQVTEA